MKNAEEKLVQAGSIKFSIIKATVIWLVLLALTLLAVDFSQTGIEHNSLLKAVLVITIVKGMLVADVFMGLNLAPKLWYRLMASYLFLVPLGIFAIYFFSI